MFMKHDQIAPARISHLLKAAEKAVRAIPPAFPLDATVAVNPFLGQTGEDLAVASARLDRVAGASLTQPRAVYAAHIKNGRICDEDLVAALAEHASAQKPNSLDALKQIAAQDTPLPKALPTLAELAAESSGVDWTSVIEKTFGLWAAGYFDQGQALWTPPPGRGAYSAWQAWARRDLTPEIAGLAGFCHHASTAPDTPDRAMMRAVDSLGISDAAAETFFHRLLMDLGGWAQHARWLLWRAELNDEADHTLIDMLAIRLVWEEALLNHVPEIKDAWQDIVQAHETPIAPTKDQVVNAILQDALERAHQRDLSARLTGVTTKSNRPKLQAAFCIDVRSEVFRRALEMQDKDIETIGFAGFFGLPVAHTAHGSNVVEAHLPVLLKPALRTTSHAAEDAENRHRIGARANRAWGRFKQAAVSSFAFVEASGPFYGFKLLKDTLGHAKPHQTKEPTPRLVEGLSAEDKASTAASVLKAMSLTEQFGQTVLLVGHGAHVTNNPHESAYHCGACGGHTGEVSARLLAQLLNDPETRAGLKLHDIDVPDDTQFVAGLHDTTTDDVTLYTEDLGGKSLNNTAVESWLKQAGKLARAERAMRLPGSNENKVWQRATSWAEVRPEWGLAGCAAFIAAPRNATAHANLEGRAFLHNYDCNKDENFSTLELILTAPVVVASWISLQYYGSTVAPESFGGGNKLIHNVVGGLGVVEGNGGRLRPGLPWQAVHDGDKLAHEPLRLTVMIEAPEDAISTIIERHPQVQELFDHGWLHLFALNEGKMVSRYCAGGAWTAIDPAEVKAA